MLLEPIQNQWLSASHLISVGIYIRTRVASYRQRWICYCESMQVLGLYKADQFEREMLEDYSASAKEVISPQTAHPAYYVYTPPY